MADAWSPLPHQHFQHHEHISIKYAKRTEERHPLLVFVHAMSCHGKGLTALDTFAPR